MSEEAALLLACEGMGDCLYAMPVIRRLWQMAQGRYVYHLFTHHPELFVHCPYVVRSSPLAGADLGTIPRDNVMTLFGTTRWPHYRMDTCDYISVPLGIGSLNFAERGLEYFPSEPDEATRYDVVINTSQTWETRSWDQANWQRLADVLLARGLSVAVVGKDVHSHADKLDKVSRPLAGCVDLTNRLSLDQTYHTIARCGLFVSCQNGLSVLAGATEARIAVLGMSIDWSHRAIYRHANPFWRVRYVVGECDIECGAIHAHDCRRAGENPAWRDRLRCIPTYEVVEAAVLDMLDKPVDFMAPPAPLPRRQW